MNIQVITFKCFCCFLFLLIQTSTQITVINTNTLSRSDWCTHSINSCFHSILSYNLSICLHKYVWPTDIFVSRERTEESLYCWLRTSFYTWLEKVLTPWTFSWSSIKIFRLWLKERMKPIECFIVVSFGSGIYSSKILLW